MSFVLRFRRNVVEERRLTKDCISVKQFAHISIRRTFMGTLIAMRRVLWRKKHARRSEGNISRSRSEE